MRIRILYLRPGPFNGMIFNMNFVCSVNTPHMQQLQARPCLEGIVSERSHEWIGVRLFFQVLRDFS